MPTKDPQATWDDYYSQKKSQRLEEAAELWALMQSAGVNEETVLAIDFVHFGASKLDVEKLADQLSENYEMQVVPSEDKSYWLAKGTTRPYGITMGQEQHLGWVEFMADVAHCHSCVFSTWVFEAPSIGAHFNSESIESAS